MSLNPLKYRPTQLNLAQRMLVAMGLDDLRLVAHHGGKRETFTKKGPGRKRATPKPVTEEQAGEFSSAMPAAFKAATTPGLFLGQHTNKTKNERRACIKAMGGIRQFKRARTIDKHSELPSGLVG